MPKGFKLAFLEEIRKIFDPKTVLERVFRNVIAASIVVCVFFVFYRHILMANNPFLGTLGWCLGILMVGVFCASMLGLWWEGRWTKEGRRNTDIPTERELILEYFISFAGPPVLLGLCWVIFS